VPTDEDEGSDETNATMTSTGALTFGTTSDVAETGATNPFPTTTTGAVDCTGIQRPPGSYADCMIDQQPDNSVCNNGDSTCLVNSTELASWGVCTFEGCTNDCECPASPGGGAEPRCLKITSDEELDCVLYCGDGLGCPSGMRCKTSGTPYCVWDEEAPVYGDCINGPDCGPGLTCVYDAGNVGSASKGVCVGLTCGDEADCPQWGGVAEVDVDCDNVQEGGSSVCYIGCDGSVPCPDGMTCFEGVQDICMWDKK
jgi:hypothetical protein